MVCPNESIIFHQPLGRGHSQNKNPSAHLGHFGIVPHPWALLVIKHKSKFIMNQTYVDHKTYEWKGSYAYSLIVGGFLHLQVDIIFLPSLTSRHNIPPNF
jgi:hypothetical protein